MKGTLYVHQMFKPQDSTHTQHRRIGNVLARRQTEWCVCTILYMPYTLSLLFYIVALFFVLSLAPQIDVHVSNTHSYICINKGEHTQTQMFTCSSQVKHHIIKECAAYMYVRMCVFTKYLAFFFDRLFFLFLLFYP